MYFKNNIPNSLITKGHKTLTFGTVMMGTVLFLLALLIFAYPASIAYFIGTVILFVGFSTLLIGWKLWRLRNEAIKLEKMDNDPFFYRSPKTYGGHFTYIRW